MKMRCTEVLARTSGVVLLCLAMCRVCVCSAVVGHNDQLRYPWNMSNISELIPKEIFDLLEEQRSTSSPTPTPPTEFEDDDEERTLDANLTRKLIQRNKEHGEESKSSLLRVAFVYAEQIRRRQHRPASLCRGEMLHQTCQHGKKRYLCSSLMSALDTQLLSWLDERPGRSRSCAKFLISGNMMDYRDGESPNVCFAELWLPSDVACRLIHNTTQTEGTDCLHNGSALPRGHFVVKSNGKTTKLRWNEKSRNMSLANRWLRLDIPPHDHIPIETISPSRPGNSTEEFHPVNLTVNICFRPTRRLNKKSSPGARLLRLYKPTPEMRTNTAGIVPAPFLMIGMQVQQEDMMLFRWCTPSKKKKKKSRCIDVSKSTQPTDETTVMPS